MLIATLAMSAAAPLAAAADPFEAIEARLSGGRLGFAAIDLGRRRMLLHRADERFALCSTFKLPLVAAVLAGVDAGRLRLDQQVAFSPDALLEYAPAVRKVLPATSISLSALCEGAAVLSDNSAANLLLPLIGGPAGLTRFMRRHGGGAARLDRIEPALNQNLPGDPRDTATPREMVGLLETLLVRPTLSPGSRGRLIGWMTACATGKARLRAGLPAGWRAGDKTGTGERGASNDVAIAWLPVSGAPILIACYVDAPDASSEARDAAHRAAATLAASQMR